MSTNYLFVYGTLKSNFDNDFARYLRANAKLVGTGIVKGRLFILGWYPGLVLDEDAYEVKGEVYEFLNDQEILLKKLDTYEGVDSDDFRRVLRPVNLNSEMINCWVYETLIENDVELKTGEFLESSN